MSQVKPLPATAWVGERGGKSIYPTECRSAMSHLVYSDDDYSRTHFRTAAKICAAAPGDRAPFFCAIGTSQCSYGLCSYGLYGYGLYRYGLYRYGLYSHGLYSNSLYSYDTYSYGLQSCDLYSYSVCSYA